MGSSNSIMIALLIDQQDQCHHSEITIEQLIEEIPHLSHSPPTHILLCYYYRPAKWWWKINYKRHSSLIFWKLLKTGLDETNSNKYMETISSSKRELFEFLLQTKWHKISCQSIERIVLNNSPPRSNSDGCPPKTQTSVDYCNVGPRRWMDLPIMGFDLWIQVGRMVGCVL